MKRLAFALCTLASLVACGERGGTTAQTGEKPPVDAAQANADLAAAHEAAGAAIDEAKQARDEAAAEKGAAARMEQYKRSVLPLIAGSYSGDCSARSGATSRAAIVVGPDGAVDAPGMKPHHLLAPGAKLMLSTEAVMGRPEKIVFVAGDEKAAWTVSSNGRGRGSTIFSDGDDAFKCENEGTPTPGKAAALYPALAPYFAAAATTMSCTDGTSLPRSYKITPSSAGVTIGDDTFSLTQLNAGEMIVLDPDEGSMQYSYKVIDGDTLAIGIDRRGAINHFTAMGRARKMYSCLAGQG